jgi:hypothetical protein
MNLLRCFLTATVLVSSACAPSRPPSSQASKPPQPSRQASRTTVRPGDEVFAVDPAHVLEVSWRSPARRVTLHRFSANRPFTVVIETAPGSRPDECTVDGAAAILEPVFSMRAIDVLDPGAAEKLLAAHPPRTWTELRIRDDTDLEPAEFLVLLPPSPGDSAWVKLRNFPDVFTARRDQFSLFSQSCSSLSAARR